jgi:hypothetical protein
MPELSSYTIKTYRYLRLAMVMLLVLLATAVLIERFETDPGCFQTSISAYYYTPAQAIFVGTLIAVGVCMVVLKGSTEREDILLNLGGMLAPVVALVPTPSKGRCFSVAGAQPDIESNVANNIPAIFVAGLLGLLLTAAIGWWYRSRGLSAGWRLEHAIGLGVSAAVLFGGFAWFLVDRGGFIDNAHYGAAFPLFVCIIAVVLLNARGYGMKTTHTTDPSRVFRNRYTVIAVLMVVLPAAMWLVSLVVDWDHLVLWVEATLLVLFAAFWVIQTLELWTEGVREVEAQPQEPAAA